jgi:hypothetical protein
MHPETGASLTRGAEARAVVVFMLVDTNLVTPFLNCMVVGALLITFSVEPAR